MEIIVISSPVNIPKEIEVIHQLFENGLKVLHMRKPEFSAAEMEDFLQQIKPAYYKRIVIHNHYNLIGRYNLKGIHFTSQALKGMSPPVIKEIRSVVKQRRLTLSASCHTIQELGAATTYDYVFLSPVFERISNADPARINLSLASVFLKNNKNKLKVIALGGVDEDKIPMLQDAGFHGIAMVDAIWNSADPCNKFERIRNQYA